MLKAFILHLEQEYAKCVWLVLNSASFTDSLELTPAAVSEAVSLYTKTQPCNMEHVVELSSPEFAKQVEKHFETMQAALVKLPPGYSQTLKSGMTALAPFAALPEATKSWEISGVKWVWAKENEKDVGAKVKALEGAHAALVAAETDLAPFASFYQSPGLPATISVEKLFELHRDCVKTKVDIAVVLGSVAFGDIVVNTSKYSGKVEGAITKCTGIAGSYGISMCDLGKGLQDRLEVVRIAEKNTSDEVFWSL